MSSQELNDGKNNKLHNSRFWRSNNERGNDMRNESIQCMRYCDTTGSCFVADIEAELFDDDNAFKLLKIFKDSHAKTFKKFVKTESARIDEIEDRLHHVESTNEGKEFLKDKLVDELNESLSPNEERYSSLPVEIGLEEQEAPFTWHRDFRCAKDTATPVEITSYIRGGDRIQTTVATTENFR